MGNQTTGVDFIGTPGALGLGRVQELRQRRRRQGRSQSGTQLPDEADGEARTHLLTGSPDRSAHIKRNTIFSEDGKVILFVTVAHLKEMLFIKERGEDPSDLIMDLVERFYVQHE